MNLICVLLLLVVAQVASQQQQGDQVETVRIFNSCRMDADCRLMNGRCFDSRGNDIGRYCSCDVGYTFDAPNGVCERQSIVAAKNASRIVAVSRVKSGIYYLEQRGAVSLTRGRARFPSTWSCDTLGNFCWTTDGGAYITSINIDAIRTNDATDTYIRYRDIIFRCVNSTFRYVRQNDDMSEDPDLGNAARPVAESCLSVSRICSSIGTGVPDASGGGCKCNLGWSGPTCQVSTVFNISRPVRPIRLCAFPSNVTCAENEQCYLWEGSSQTTQGYCWCRAGYLPAAASSDVAGLTPSACIRTPTLTYFGAIAEPYLRDAPAFRVLLDAKSRQYAHYTGQGYEYASIMPYPVSLNNTLFRINDTLADAPGYLWRCDLSKAYWNATSGNCTLNWTYVPPTQVTANESALIRSRYAYDGCGRSFDAFGPNCTMNGTECRDTRCTGHGQCVGVYQGCECDPGWGLYNCSVRTCKPNVQDPGSPHVFFASIGQCNCSAAYLGTYCDWYTCGNRFATYRPASQGGCQCGGDWILNETTGNCTATPCPEFHTLSELDPSVCVRTVEADREETGETEPQILPPPGNAVVYAVTDDRAAVKAYEPTTMLYTMLALVFVQIASLTTTVLNVSGAFIHG